ncbi:hypothetical protein PV327_003042 [Microctonus hyperodae]|uniref:GHMP kinase C-terminal domain-containing protein n=1 Tax=Microctonus hyperodae TaxID=165561 RepID=A0AA39L0L7_MICHY|nr:hypothetical protein PV327_003042 [Microctonus hyperodae]
MLGALLIVIIAALTLISGENSSQMDNTTLQQRSGRFFPLFSIVRFANSECSGTNAFNGTCFTRKECANYGGSVAGTCANKLGKICQSNKPDRIQRLGELMNQSHESLRDFYECSHEILDKLVDVAINCGALGARLTGAGWGGCLVALTTRNNVEKFVNDLRDQIRKGFFGELMTNCDLKTVVFPTEPRQGAAIYYMPQSVS